MDEKEAIGLLLNKHLEGLTWLMEKYQVRALRAAVLVTRDRALAEDVVQGKFVELYRKVHTYDPARPFSPWFLRGVVNAAISAAISAKTVTQGAYNNLMTGWNTFVTDPAFKALMTAVVPNTTGK